MNLDYLDPRPDTSHSTSLEDGPRPDGDAYSHKYNVSYSEKSRLNTLDLHIPYNFNADGSAQSLYWVIFIHGGAWRDPLQTSQNTLLPALPHLNPLKHRLAGVASLNYRLSPYPMHPTNPSHPDDPARNAAHPNHLQDILSALSFLQSKYRIGSRYILAGHSCGATLAYQALQRLIDSQLSRREDGAETSLPAAVCGIEGIYDLVKLRDTHRGVDVYQTFLEAAFGRDEKVWREAGPVNAEWSGREAARVVKVLAHSREDELVEFSQAEQMRDVMREHGEKDEAHVRRSRIEFVELTGTHAQVYEEGRELAKAIVETLRFVKEMEK